MRTETGEHSVDHQPLRELCTAIQAGCGVPQRDAQVVSDCLVEANLMGLDTHGVIRLKFYRSVEYCSD